MDITKGDGWEKLCQFLDKPIPKNIPFPSNNIGTDGVKEMSANSLQTSNLEMKTISFILFVFLTFLILIFRCYGYIVKVKKE